MDCLELNKINHFLLNKHHLGEDLSGRELVQVIQDVGGLHASQASTPYLSTWARIPDFEKEHLSDALYEDLILGKMRSVRKTLYIHTKEMLPVVYKATAGTTIKASKHYMTYRGVSRAAYETLSLQILGMLDERPMTSAEIKVDIDTDADISAVLYYMCDLGLLVRGRPVGGWKNNTHCYQLFDNVFPDVNLNRLDERTAIVKLVRYYLASFGPVTMNDIAWWTGLGKIRVRAAFRSLADEVIQVSICETGERMVLLADDLERIVKVERPATPVINLLPCLDGLIMGYTKRDRYVNPDYQDLVFDSSGNATNTILVDGKVHGVWGFEDGEPPQLKLHVFEYTIPLATQRISAQAKDVGRFICDREVRLKQCEEMIPLTSQPAGRFKSPLKDS